MKLTVWPLKRSRTLLKQHSTAGHLCSPRDLYLMFLSSSSRGERKSNQNLASFMGAPRSIVVCVLVQYQYYVVLHMHDHFTVKLDNLPESSDARASPRQDELRCIFYGIFESIFFRMTGRFNGPFVEILVSAIIGASWLLEVNVSRMSPKLVLT